MSAQFRAIGIAPTRIDGILAKSLSYDEKLAVSTPFCASHCPYGALGVTIAHVNAWKQAARYNEPILICEDDVVFAPNFISKCKEAIESAPEWDIIYPGCLMCHDVPLLPDLALRLAGTRNTPELINDYLWKPPYLFGAHCYILSPRGVRKLLHLGKIPMQIDVWLNHLSHSYLQSFALRTLVASQEVSLVRGGSSVIDSAIPTFVNGLLETVRIAPEISAAYGLTFPFVRFGDYTVNTWTFLFLVYGFACRLFGLSLGTTLLLAGSVMGPDILHVKHAVAIALVLCAIGYTISGFGDENRFKYPD